MIGVDVGANGGEKVGTVASVGKEGAQTGELPPVLFEDFAVASKVVLFQSGRGESSFGVQKARELGDECFSLGMD